MDITVSKLAEKLELTVLAGRGGLDKKVKDMHIGDLLSWVMGNAEEGSAWVTIQGHVNIIAVAMLVEISCIIIAGGANADSETLKKADDEDIPVLSTSLPAYKIAAAFCQLTKSADF